MKKKLYTFFPYVIAILALIGFSDALFLSMKRAENVIPSCSLTGCENVLTSQYSEIFGISVALIGVIYYSFHIVFSILGLVWKRKIFQYLQRIFVTGGMAMTLYFVFLQLFVIKSICMYCMLSATVTTVMFVLIWSRRRKF